MQDELMFTDGPTSFEDKGYSSGEKRINLQPLTPESRLSAENPAIRALHECYMDSRIRNIAITGPYGAGKSSIIASFVRQRNEPTKFINISISSIANADRKANESFNLEREISKQILNFNPSGRIGQPRNSLRSFSQTELFGQLVWFSIASIVLILLLILIGLGPFGTWNPSAWEYFLLLAGVVALTFLLGRFLATKNLAAKISAGFAEIDIKKQEVSSFDEYSSQLVTFFQNRPGTTIILEDIDRFDDPTIFDRLHDLNVLLNSATGVDLKNQPIRFIYALRDSIFEDKDLHSETKKKEEKDTPGTIEELQRTKEAFSESSRRKTKFFDVVIPVLPIVNRSNSFVQICHQLDRSNVSVSFPVISHVAEFVQDQRLITSIVNEFSVLKESFDFPNLSRNRAEARKQFNDMAFAITAYKNLFPRDFERSQFGESTLDKVIDGFNDDKRKYLLKKLQEAKAKAASDDLILKAFRLFIRKEFLVIKSSGENYPVNRKFRRSNWGDVKKLFIRRHEIPLKVDQFSVEVSADSLREISRSFRLNSIFSLELSNHEKISVRLAEATDETWGSFLDGLLDDEKPEKWRSALQTMSRIVRLDLSRVLGGIENPFLYGIDDTERLLKKVRKRLASDSPELREFLEPLILGGYLVHPVGDVLNKQFDSENLPEDSLANQGYGFQQLSKLLRNQESIRLSTWANQRLIKELFSFSERGLDRRRQISIPKSQLDHLVLLQNMAALNLLENRDLYGELLKEIYDDIRATRRWSANLIYTCSQVPYAGLKNSSLDQQRSFHPLFEDLWNLAPDGDTFIRLLMRVLFEHPRFGYLNKEINYYIPPGLRELLEGDNKLVGFPRTQMLLSNLIEQAANSEEFEKTDFFKDRR